MNECIQVYQILDEMVIGGEHMETSKPIINKALKHTDYYDWGGHECELWFIVNIPQYWYRW